MSEWRSSGMLAWTEREGPPRPPTGPTRIGSGVLAAALGFVLVVLVSNDTLCPEHRAWVQALAGASLTGAAVAGFGLVRSWSAAPWITVVSALGGVSIGLIDAAHDPGRGRAIAIGFGVCAGLAALLAVQHLRLLRWDRRLRADVEPVVMPSPVTDPQPTQSTQPAQEREREAATPAP